MSLGWVVAGVFNFVLLLQGMLWTDFVRSSVPWRGLADGTVKSCTSLAGVSFEGRAFHPIWVHAPSTSLSDRRYTLDVGGTELKPALSLLLTGVPRPALAWGNSDVDHDEASWPMDTFYVCGLYPRRFAVDDDDTAPVAAPHEPMTGNALLRFLDHIAHESKVTKYTLTDESTLDIADQHVCLAKLGILTTGQTWYERHGFLPNMTDHAMAVRRQAHREQQRQTFLFKSVNMRDLQLRLAEHVGELHKLQRRRIIRSGKNADDRMKEWLAMRMSGMRWLLRQHQALWSSRKSRITVRELFSWMIRDWLTDLRHHKEEEESERTTTKTSSSRCLRQQLAGYEELWDVLESERFGLQGSSLEMAKWTGVANR